MKRDFATRLLNLVSMAMLIRLLFGAAHSGALIRLNPLKTFGFSMSAIWALAFALIYFGTHFLWAHRGRWMSELIFVGGLGTIGWLIDGYWNTTEVLRFYGPYQWAPLWLLLIWCGVVATFRSGLEPFFRKPATAAVTGLILGPMIEGFAIHQGLIGVPNGIVNFVMVIGLTWALLFGAATYLMKWAR